jgi:predicted RNase H-like nuclease
MHTAMGIDGCRGGWFWFRFDGDTATFGVGESFAPLVEDLPPGACALVDMPIGLRARGKRERECDRAARALLGPRRASVFAAPVRPLLKARDYASALAQSRRLTGRGLSKQSWNLVPKIREVDGLLRARPALARQVLEAHPEVLFAGLAGGPMSATKSSREGFAQRMTILSILHPDAETLIASAFLAHGGFEAARDDVVDAFVLALCARKPTQLKTLPAAPETDPFGLPMQMVYLPGLQALPPPR